MRTTELSNRDGPGKLSGRHDTRVVEMRKTAARHRERAEEFYALARECLAHADQIVFEEFGRRELEACRHLERCLERRVKAGPRPGHGDT